MLLFYKPIYFRIMKDNKYFCYTIDNSGERGYQRIDKEFAIQLNDMGR